MQELLTKYREYFEGVDGGRNYVSNKLAEYISIYGHYLEGNDTVSVDNFQNEE